MKWTPILSIFSLSSSVPELESRFWVPSPLPLLYGGGADSERVVFVGTGLKETAVLWKCLCLK